MLKKSLLLSLFLVLAISLQATAQDVPPGKWWRDPGVVKSLELTDSQVKALENAYTKSRRNLIKQKSRMESEQFELQNMFDRKNVDEKAVEQQYLNVEKARKDLSTEQFKYIMEVRKIIGYDKYNQLTHGQASGKSKHKK